MIWSGDPIDVVRMPDGTLITVDNTRLYAAQQTGTDVQAVVHDYNEPLPEEFVERFTTTRGGIPITWGDAVENRIGNQNSYFRNIFPQGSPYMIDPH